MKLHVNNEPLRKVLAQVGKLASDRHVLIMNDFGKDHVVVTGTKKDGIWLTGSNGDRFLTKRIPGEVLAAGAAHCRFSTLRNFLAKMGKKEDLFLESAADENEDYEPLVVVATDKLRYLIDTERPGSRPRAETIHMGLRVPMAPFMDVGLDEDYDDVPDVVYELRMQAEGFDQWLADAEELKDLTVVSGDHRPWIQTIHWSVDFEKGFQEMVATDGTVLGWIKKPIPNSIERTSHEFGSQWRAGLHPNALPYLKHLTGDGEVLLTCCHPKPKDEDDKDYNPVLHFLRDGSHFWSYGWYRYVDFKSLFPDANHEMVVDADALIGPLERLAVIRTGTANPSVALTLGRKSVTIEDSRASGQFNIEELPAKVKKYKAEGESLRMGYDIRNMLRVLKRFEGQKVRWVFNGPASIASVWPVEPGDDLEKAYLIMPMRATPSRRD